MSDKLENHIQDSKEKFEHKLSEQHRERFANQLDKELLDNRKNSFPKWLQIAASIAILFGAAYSAYWFGKSSQKTEIAAKDDTMVQFTLQHVSPEMKEVEHFFQTQLEEKNKLARLAVQDNPDLKDFFHQLNQLEIQYEELCEELNHQQNNERIIQSMIQNYKLRLSLLEKLLLETNRKNQHKGIEHEMV